MASKPQRAARTVVGWREWVRLPTLGIPAVKAKVDTGARSSALHAFDIEIDDDVDPVRVTFKVHPNQDDAKTTVICEAVLHDRRWIKSSNGKRELRPVIRTDLELHEDVWSIDLTLTSRDMMGFRMLLGREAIRRRFYVDPGTSFVAKAFLPSKVQRKKSK